MASSYERGGMVWIARYEERFLNRQVDWVSRSIKRKSSSSIFVTRPIGNRSKTT